MTEQISLPTKELFRGQASAAEEDGYDYIYDVLLRAPSMVTQYPNLIVHERVIVSISLSILPFKNSPMMREHISYYSITYIFICSILMLPQRLSCLHVNQSVQWIFEYLHFKEIIPATPLCTSPSPSQSIWYAIQVYVKKQGAVNTS